MAENTILDAKAGDLVNNSVAPDKRYMITRDSLPNKVSKRDADWWEQNRDKVFSDYDDVHAFEVSPYDANDVKETDQYIITLKDQPGVSMRDGKWWAENSERMYKDYPNAQVERVRYIDYWYDKAMRDKENIESLEDEIASLREQQSSYQRWSPEYNEYERKIAQKQTDLISVEDSYNKNPRVVEAEKRYQEQYRALQEEYKENYIANLFSQIEEWKNEDVAKGRSYSTLSESQGEEIAMHTSRMAAMGQRMNGDKDSGLQKTVSESNARIGRTRDYVSAEAVLEWAVEHRNNYRSVWQGLAQGLEEMLSGHLAQVETTTEAAFRKLEKKYGDPSFLTNEDIERELEPNEKAAIYAYFQFLASDEEVQEKASSAYKGGKQFADMIPFLIEFALLKAPAEALAERATSKMALKLGTWALAKSGFKGIARQMTAKAIVGTVDAAVAGAVMTAASPLVVSSVRDTIQAGGGPTEVLKTIGNEYIERFTEFAGDGLAKMLGVLGEGFKTTKVGSKIANSAFGKGWSTFFNSKGMQVIGNFGIQSFPIEVFEELEAAAIREMLALDSKALDQFFDEDNFMTMLISFAPMQLIGVASSATAMGVAKHDLGSTREIMYKELSANYDNKIIDNAANAAMSAKTPKEVEDAMRPLLKQMIEDGASFKQIKSMLNYFKAVATYKTFVSVSEERDRSLIDAKYTEIEDNVGDFWVKMAEDIEGVRQVRVAQLNDGRTVFVTSAANEQGEFTIKDAATGKIGYAKESDIAETQDENGNTIRLDNTMNIDDFLNAEVMSERQNAEVKRMTEERQAQIDAMKQRLAENKQINLGTEEAPQIVVAKSMTNDGVQVVDESGNSAVLSWEQVGNVIGTPLDVKTDAQIVEQEIAGLLSKQAERKVLLAQGRIITPAQADAAVSEAEESIAAANPVHIPTNPDGSVDENAFWNANPQGWAEWNDEQNNDGGVDSYEQITAAKAELTARLAEIQKLQATSNPANRRQAKAEAQQISARLAEIDALEKQYAEKLQTPEQKRAAVEQAIRDRAEQWQALTGVKIVVVENASEIKNADVAQAMANGSTVMAWTTGNEAYVYLPNIDSVEMFDQKFAHEVVAHIGIKELLGKKGYEAFCEKVWTVMSPAAQRHFLAYPGVKGNPILAADEYIAHIAEQMGSGVANMEEQSVWQKIVQFFKEMLNSILGVYAQELTEQEILNNIKLSFANLVEKQGVAQEAADQTRLSAREEIDALASELTPEEMAAVINNDLQAAQEAYAKLSASAPVVEPGESSKAFIERKRAYAEQLAAAKAEMEAKQAIVDEAARMAEEQQPEEAAALVEEAAPRSLEPTIVEDENGEAMAETDGNGSVRFSVLTYEQGGREYLVNWLAGEKYMDQSEKDFIIATLDQQYNLAKQLGKDFPVFGAWSSAEVDVDAEGNPIMSVIKANGDYSMNLDFSLICKKRRPLNALLDVMIADRMLDMRTLNEGEIAKINKVIQRHGFEVACALCFVDSKRYRVVKVAADFADLYNDLVQSLIPAGSDIVATEYNYAGYEYINERNAEKTGRTLDTVSDVELDWTKVDEVLKGVKTPKTVEQKVAKMLRDNPEFRKLANATDFVTNLGFESVKRNNPELLKVYNAKKGTGGPKASFGDVQYLNDILKSKSFTPEKAYSVGGVRVQSFSDYMGHMFFDYMQMMAELAAKGLPAHAYTKEEAFARIFGMTGMKINMSLVPAVKADGVAPGLDAEGNYAWAVPYTDEQGNEIQGQTFPPEVAFEMQQDPRYSGNVGVIAVGVSDEHILKMLDDENIHFIIPYHKSSISGIVAKETNIDQFKDYTLTQNTKLAPTEENNSLSPKQKKKILEQKAFDFYKSLGRTHDPKVTAQEYLDHCKNNGLVPKFEQFANHENYYKLLVDFNTYDFVTGEYAPQGPVKMNFPEELEALVKASVASNEVLESDLKDKVGKMAEDVKAELGETRFSANTENKSISLQNNGNNEQNEQETFGPDTNVGWEANSSGVAGNTAGIVERTRDRSDIRVFEQGLESSRSAHSDDSERARRDAESERLVDIAKKNNLYIPLKDTDSLGEKVQKRTGESVVYIDEETGRVFKVKDPYAKSAMKAGVEPEDAIYEHIVHNLVFPEAPYQFVGISDKLGDVRIVLSQDRVESVQKPTKAQIAEALASKGLLPENAYSFGNDLISVTDVEGDNVLLGEDGTVYFIDPIIRFKKPVQEVIETLSAEEGVRFSARTDEQRTALFDNAKQHYGLTNNFNAAGYMLPDGSLLDFSEANDGGDPNQRSLDHRNIEGIIMDEGKEYDSRWMYIADFMNEGAIRLLPEYAGINIMQAPTAEQRKRLFDFIYKYNGKVILEIADERLNNIAYVEYDRRTSPARVLRDIDGYFNNGVIPQQDIRFSVANESQAIFVSNAAKAVEGIKMEKATPAQWLAMIEKNGGLKAGEDKWMGLSEWLKASDKKTLTKAEVLEFVNEHAIKIEETHYDAYAEEKVADAYAEMGRILQDKFNAYRQEYYEQNEDEDLYGNPANDYAIERLREELGDEFPYAIEVTGAGDVYLTFPYEDDAEMRKWSEKLGVEYNPQAQIENIRLVYTTDGLTNKREIALTVPTIESWGTEDMTHFGDAGEGRAVAWIRFGETEIPTAEYKLLLDEMDRLKEVARELYEEFGGRSNELAEVEARQEELRLEMRSYKNAGLKVLVIDEIQSKRHQEGREKGYATMTQEEYTAQMNEKYGTQYFGWQDKATPEEWETYRSLAKAIPAAPFEKNWAELAMKRMLRYAAEEGYDAIAWTKGDQQAERYNLGGVVKKIKVSDIHTAGVNDEHVVRIVETEFVGPQKNLHLLFDENGEIVGGLSQSLSDYKGKDIRDIYGKELGEKILSLTEDTTLKGNDLRIGGEGMRGFYDRMLPSFMNKYGKKWGVKVEDINLPNLEDGLTMHSIPVTEEMKASVMEGQTMFSISTPAENKYTQQHLPNYMFDTDVRFSLSKNNRQTITGWMNKRTDLPENVKEEVLNLIDQYSDATLQLCIGKWFSQGTIALPEDLDQCVQAVVSAKRAKVNALSYSNPMEIINEFGIVKSKKKPINPDTVSTLKKSKVLDNGIVIYDVEESEESRKNMREIINTHYGVNASPWCLLQGDENGNLTEKSAEFWQSYNAVPKRVVFRDGKLLAFYATANRFEKVWWDRLDRPWPGIPVSNKDAADPLKREVTRLVSERSGKLGKIVSIMREDRLDNGGKAVTEWGSMAEDDIILYEKKNANRRITAGYIYESQDETQANPIARFIAKLSNKITPKRLAWVRLGEEEIDLGRMGRIATYRNGDVQIDYTGSNRIYIQQSETYEEDGRTWRRITGYYELSKSGELLTVGARVDGKIVEVTDKEALSQYENEARPWVEKAMDLRNNTQQRMEELKGLVQSEQQQTRFSATPIVPHQSSIDEVDQMFADWNRDPFVGELYAKVSDLAHKMNLKIKFVEPWSDAGGANILDKVKYNVDYFNSNDYAQTKAGVLLHELIHAVTVYAVVAKNSPILTQGMKDAVMQIEAIYDEIKNDPSFDGTYGVKSEKEMIAELSNPRFRQKLRAKNLLQRIVDAIKQLLGIDKGANAEDNLEGTLEYMIENFDQNAFDIVLKANEKKDAYTLFSALPTKNDFEVEKKAMLGISMMHGFVPFDEMGKTFRTLINEREAMVQRLASKANKTAYDNERLARLEQDLEAAYRQLEWWENVQADLVPTEEVQPEVSKDMEPQSFEEYLSQFFTMSKTKTETKTITDENGKKKTIRLGGKRNGVMLTPETLTSEMGWKSGDWAGIKYIVSAKDGMSLDAIAEMIEEDEDAKQFLGNMDTMDIKNAVMDFLQSVGTYAEIRDYVKHQRAEMAQLEADRINGDIQAYAQSIEDETGMTVEQYNAMLIEEAFKAAEENLTMLESSEIYGNFEELTEDEYERYVEEVIRGEEGRVYEGNEDFEGEQSGHVLPDNEWSSENDEERTGDDSNGEDSGSEGDRGGEAGGAGIPPVGHSKPGVVSDHLETEGLSVEEIVETGKQKVAAENADAADVFMQKLRKINEKLSGLRSALAAQREYDQNTVKILTSLANDLLEGGKLTDMTRGEIKRLLSVIKDATGKSDLSVSVDRLMDIMIANQLRFAKNRFADLLKIKASKVNASGVEAQGKLDVQGQQIMQSLKDAMKASEEVLNDWIAEAENDLDSDSYAVRHNAELKLAGYELARQYKEDIEASETEEAALREDLKKTEHEGKLTKEQLKEYRKTIYDAVRENKMARVNSYEAMLESLSSMLAGSVARAVAFREAETQRVENIHHMANSDMQGMPADEHNKKDSWFWNSSLVRFLFKPLATFDQMLRAFAPKSRSGEGYLWNHFMGGWLKATENEYKGIQDAHERLDAYARYFFGVQRWSDLFALERKLPKAEVTWWNAGKMETFEVSQGNLLYIYMINKMADGRMKLRKMGITEDDVDNIIRSIDPRFLDLADWIQERFLPSLREKYNDVHERLFGAPMAAIDNYFPIRVLANARAREVDLGVDESNAKPSTITGNIIKRTKNSLALDILGSDAFDVVLGHIEEMEKWAAFAEWNKDLNTLLSYKKFRNRVQNMAGIYGAGNVVWNNFRSAAEIAAGVYKPATKNDSVDKAIMNIAKGVTGAKISFRVYTAFKQLLSWPAFLSDARTDILAKNMANPFGAWKWSMENLPLFEKRWKSRQAGDSRLMETESDWKIWKSKAVEIAGRLGMTPNAFVDAVTVAIGARSIYETRLKKYLDYGYSQEVAEEKAKRDATVLFNESQQSNESAFLSQIQVDRTVASVVFTVFRNSSMGYQRMYVDAIRNIGRMMKPGYKGESVEYMTKQMVRDGLTPEQAERAANRIYNRSFAKNAMQALTFGFIVQLAWNLGPYLPYIFGGDDDEKKKEMAKDATIRALVGGPVEGLAGGNILSNAIGNLAMGESLSKVSGAQLPLASDIENTFKLFGNDNVRAYNELFNLAVQSFVGVNPQTISDVVVAVIDACNGDLETSTEAMLCIMRILQVPQSQIENFYIDEIDFKADEAYDMTVKEFAERYAKYKVMRNAPITQWMYTDDEEKEKEDKYIKLFTQKAKEERKKRGSEEAKAWYQYVEGAEYKEVDQTLKDIREQIEAEAHAGRFDSDIIRAAQQKMMDLQQTPAFQKYMDAKMIKSQTDKLKEAPDWVDVSELKKLRKEKFDKVFKESNSVE